MPHARVATFRCLLAALLLTLLPFTAGATDLHRGINVTNWFRFPASTAPAALRAYLPDPALATLRHAGFDFIRLAVDPTLIAAAPQRAALIAAITRIQHQGLSVIISLHPPAWHLETSAADRAALRHAWRLLAPDLARLDQARTIPEILNEPVFPNAAADWAALQHSILTDLRHTLPRATIILTGADWGSIDGLLALPPEPDPNVLYSFHFYEPAELTALAPWRHDIDRAALTHLPFPVTAPCDPTAPDPTTADLIRYYCAMHWDAARIRAAIARATAWAATNHTHLFAGEFGATAELNPPARLAWITTVRTTLESAGIPWALWGLDDIMGFNLPRPPPAHPHLDPALLAALGLSTSL